MLVTVLALYLDVGASDIPAQCTSTLLETCLKRHAAAGGAADSGLVTASCGQTRVGCWHSGAKQMIYNGGALPNAHTTYVPGIGPRLRSTGLGDYLPYVELCQCLLTSNGTEPYPQSPTKLGVMARRYCKSHITRSSFSKWRTTILIRDVSFTQHPFHPAPLQRRWVLGEDKALVGCWVKTTRWVKTHVSNPVQKVFTAFYL